MRFAVSVSVYDCFLFFNELGLLEIRLNVLFGVVDKFVLVEADRTFTNKSKLLYFDENKDRYKCFLDKIVHVKISEYPSIGDAWDMENFQRNQIEHGITQCFFDDIILISDLDEIPNPKIIMDYKKNGNGICRLRQMHFAYFLNYQRCDKYWYPAKIARYKNITLNNYTPQNIRSRSLKTKRTIKNAGWHFSFLGGMENIKYKIQSFSHQEWNNDHYVNNQIDKKIRMGLDLFDRKHIRLIPVKITKKHPQYIFDNQEKYAHLIYPHMNRLVVIKNTIYCLPYLLIRAIKATIKKILPQCIIKKIKLMCKRTTINRNVLSP